MALSVKVGTFKTGTGTSNIVVTGVGFQPSCLIAWMNGRTEIVDTVGRRATRRSFGVAVSTSDRRVVIDGASDGTGGGSFTTGGQRDDSLLSEANNGAFAGRADLSSFDADGFTLSVPAAFGADYTVHYIALGGADLTNVKTGTFVEPSGTGNQSFTGLGFQPSLVIFFSASLTNSFPQVTGFPNFGGHCIGLGKSSSAQEVWLGGTATPAINAAKSYCLAGECIALGKTSGSTWVLDARATLVSLDSDGFTVNWLAATAGARVVQFLAIKGPSVAVGDTATRTDTNDIAVSGFGFSPKLVGLLTHCKTQSSAGTLQADNEYSLGAFTGVSERGAQGSIDIDGGSGGTSDVTTAIEVDKVYVNTLSAGTQGLGDAVSLDGDGFTWKMTTADNAANFVPFFALGDTSGATTVSKQHNVDADVQADVDKTHNVDAVVQTTSDKTHDVDAFVDVTTATVSKTHNVDAYVNFTDETHSVDAYIQSLISKTHNVDCSVLGGATLGDKVHNVDAWIEFSAPSYVKLAGNIIFVIDPTQGYVKLNSTILQPQREAVNLAATLKSVTRQFVNLAATLKISTRSYVRLAADLSGDKLKAHNVDAVVATPQLSYVQLIATLNQPLTIGACGGFPDASYVKLEGWLVDPGGSIQMPGSGFSLSDDFLSSQIALSVYRPISIVKVIGGTLPPGGISLIITALTVGVVSSQTRTRTWLQRVDAAPSGILLTTEVNTHTLANGAIITTTTQKRQVQDTLITIVTIQNSQTPTRQSVIVTEKTKGGQSTTREIETHSTNGVINKVEKKTVFTQPPSTENIQPIRVRTLDGIEHFQFFGQSNSEWVGGDQEGLTVTSTKEQIVPSSLNGQTVDQFGNPILAKITDETVQKPTGEYVQTHTEEIGTRRDVGTTVSDTTQNFDGIVTIIHKVTTYPDGSQDVVDTTTNNITGDSTETTNETVTDEFGQITTTVTVVETKTFTDPVTGKIRQTETKTVNVTKSGVDTVDTTVLTTDNFEDDIIDDKIKVIFIQEFTLNVVIDEMNMEGLAEINITHQKQFALLELFGQQLGNANLSYAFRQRLIQQFNEANSCIAPFTLQALGRLYRVVFAPSASAFRAKYIPGTEPHVYELQMILQERSDLITGTRGF